MAGNFKKVTELKILKESEFRNEIKNSPAKAYLFFGEEDYMKNHALSLASKAISPDTAFAPFNDMRLDALSYTPAALSDMLMPMPMMSDRKLVVVSGLDFNAMKSGEIDSLCSVLGQLDEYDYNTVIINTSSDRFDWGILPKRPSALLTRLSEFATPVYFEKNSPSRLASWVGKHYEHNNVSAEPQVCMFTVEYCGRDMFRLALETEKISYYVLSSGRDQVTEDDVRSVSVNTNEYDAFAFTNAINASDKDKALMILGDLKAKKTDPILIMGEITRSVCDVVSVNEMLNGGFTVKEISDMLKIHEYRITLIVKSKFDDERSRILLRKCKKADMDIKSTADGYKVLEKLICTF